MKTIIPVVLLAIAFPSLPVSATPEFHAVSDWVLGGTLHSASVAEWNRATEANMGAPWPDSEEIWVNGGD